MSRDFRLYCLKGIFRFPDAVRPSNKPKKEHKSIRAAEDLTIKGSQTQHIFITGPWLQGQETAFVESSSQTPAGLTLLKGIVSKDDSRVVIINLTSHPILLAKGQPLGRFMDANRVLDPPSKEQITEALQVKTVIDALATPPSTEEGPGEFDAGPKPTMAYIPEAKETDLLKDINVNPELTPEQKMKLKEVIQC